MSVDIGVGPTITVLIALWAFHCMSRAMGYREAMKDAIKIYETDRDDDDMLSAIDEKGVG